MSLDHDPAARRHDGVDRPPPRRGWCRALLDRVRPWIEWFGLGRVVAAAVTVVAVVVGGWWLLQTPTPPTEAGLPYAAATTTAAAATPPATSAPPGLSPATVPSRVVVHVAGAVVRPGVYEVPGGARVHAAIDAAGGALPEAAPGSLNLAAPLTDGERIYVPVVGEDLPPAALPAPIASTPAGPIDLNRASAAELDELPGVGPATAQAIVDHRTTNGPFAAVDDLEAVRGIGPAKLEAIRPLVTV